MSIVGPRPLLPEYLNFCTETQKERQNVKPGITGWTQINERNATNWDTKLKYDLWYIEQQSFGLDNKIIFKTLQKVFNVENINATNSTIIEPFYGK